MLSHSRVFATATLLSAMLVPSLAHAEPPQVKAQPTAVQMDEARAFLKEGRDQLAAEHYERAVILLEKAYKIMPAPTIAFELIRAYFATNQLVEAWSVGEKVQQTPPGPNEPAPFMVARKDIDKAMDGLATKIPTFVFRFEEPPSWNVRLFVDEQALTPLQNDKPYRINNRQTHRIRAEAEGYTVLEIETFVDVPMAEEIPIRIKMNEAPKPSKREPLIVEPPKPKATPVGPSPLAKPMWITFGASLGVALGTGIGAGLAYGPMEDAWYERGCGNQCESQFESRRATVQNFSITTVVFGSLSVASLIVALVNTPAPRKKTDSSAYLVPTVNGASVVGTW